jgi:hypothetical protein
MRERIERGLDPSEGDRPNEAPLLRLDFELIRPPGYAAGTAAAGSSASSNAPWFRSM